MSKKNKEWSEGLRRKRKQRLGQLVILHHRLMWLLLPVADAFGHVYRLFATMLK